MKIIQKITLTAALLVGASSLAFAQNATVGAGANSQTGVSAGRGNIGLSTGSSINAGAGANAGGIGLNSGANVSGNGSLGAGGAGSGRMMGGGTGASHSGGRRH